MYSKTFIATCNSSPRHAISKKCDEKDKQFWNYKTKTGEVRVKLFHLFAKARASPRFIAIPPTAIQHLC